MTCELESIARAGRKRDRKRGERSLSQMPVARLAFDDIDSPPSRPLDKPPRLVAEKRAHVTFADSEWCIADAGSHLLRGRQRKMPQLEPELESSSTQLETSVSQGRRQGRSGGRRRALRSQHGCACVVRIRDDPHALCLKCRMTSGLPICVRGHTCKLCWDMPSEFWLRFMAMYYRRRGLLTASALKEHDLMMLTAGKITVKNPLATTEQLAALRCLAL